MQWQWRHYDVTINCHTKILVGQLPHLPHHRLPPWVSYQYDACLQNIKLGLTSKLWTKALDIFFLFQLPRKRGVFCSQFWRLTEPFGFIEGRLFFRRLGKNLICQKSKNSTLKCKNLIWNAKNSIWNAKNSIWNAKNSIWNAKKLDLKCKKLDWKCKKKTRF